MINYRDDNGFCTNRESASSNDLVFNRPIYIRFRFRVPPYSRISNSNYRMRLSSPIGANGIRFKAEIFIQAPASYAEQCQDDIEPDGTLDVVTSSFSKSNTYIFNFGNIFQKFVNTSNWLNVDYVTIKLTPADDNTKVLTVKSSIFFTEHFQPGNKNYRHIYFIKYIFS